MIESNNSNAVDFINDFRSNLFQDEVYVFTPNGDLKVLPAGATALDFAFEIHSEVGYHCLGAKVNQKLVPISHKLVNGDQVEILTSSKQKPTEDWLKIVVSGKAINKIRESLREDKKLLATEGKEILARKAKQIKLDLSEETMVELRTHFKVKTNLELHFRIGTGVIAPQDIKKFKELKDAGFNTQVPTLAPSTILDGKSLERELKKIRGTESDMLLIGEDLDSIKYTFAKCCNPIQGDDVFGFVTVTEGIKIHRTTCPNAVELMSNYGYRIIKAKWTNQKEVAFLAGLRFTGTDRLGIVNDISKIISNDLKVNMRSITIQTDDGIFDGQIMLYVNDTIHLDALINKLKKVQGIVSVFRFDGN
jgi:GTP pyrophosphokinase